jgi:hypothetical protein
MAFWGIIRALQSDLNICYPPSLQLPLINEDLPGRAAAGVFHNRFSSTGRAVPRDSTTVCPVHNFLPPSELLVCYQPHRQKVVPGQTSMYETFSRRNCFANLDILHGELEGGYPQVKAGCGASLHHLLTRRQEGVEGLYKK